MRPLKEMPVIQLKAIRYILCDIDDTITVEGSLTAETFTMLHKLKDTGFRVIPVTGRPAGWCDHIARFWPVEGIVGENGAFYFRYESSLRKMLRHYVKDEHRRQQDSKKLKKIQNQILKEIPGTALSADQAYREADLAIDFQEDVPPLSKSSVQKIVDIFENHGAKAKVSSIHVNGWFGDYDKCSMSYKLLRQEFCLDHEKAKKEVLFIGDSPNDCPMFGAFPVSVGVANVLNFKDLLEPAPEWVTEKKGGYGFAEMARFLISHKENGNQNEGL